MTPQENHNQRHAALRAEQHYRELEQSYYQAAQYAEMIARYPLLQNSIAACRSGVWISDSTVPASAPVPAHLHWERSHGED